MEKGLVVLKEKKQNSPLTFFIKLPNPSSSSLPHPKQRPIDTLSSLKEKAQTSPSSQQSNPKKYKAFLPTRRE